MDVIVTAIGELIWAASCAVVNFCASSGVSVVAVFVSFLCAILASAFYKYTISREQMSMDDIPCDPIDQDDKDLEKAVIITPTTESSIPLLVPETANEESNTINAFDSLSEIEISVDENTNESENGEDDDQPEIGEDILIETIEGTEEEIQKQQIANIFRLLNDQHLINNWSNTDFLDQLKMYGLHAYDEDEANPS